jgi:DNA replication protein DnaC
MPSLPKVPPMQKSIPAKPMSNKLVRFPNFSEYQPQEENLEPGTCLLCKGAGWLRIDALPGDPNFGRTVPCECTIAERERKEAEELERVSNIESFRELTFETFNARVKGVKEAFEAAVQFSRDPSHWLMFIGNYGCGKTHLAAAIANDAIKKRNRVYFAIVPDLLDYLRATFAPNSDSTYDERFDMIRNVPLLILDDLGTENASAWAREKLYQIINHRYNAKLPTVITTNNDLDRMDGRIRSRVCDMSLCQVVFLEAEDYRLYDVQQRETLRQLNRPRSTSTPRNRGADY